MLGQIILTMFVVEKRSWYVASYSYAGGLTFGDPRKSVSKIPKARQEKISNIKKCFALIISQSKVGRQAWDNKVKPADPIKRRASMLSYWIASKRADLKSVQQEQKLLVHTAPSFEYQISSICMKPDDCPSIIIHANNYSIIPPMILNSWLHGQKSRDPLATCKKKKKKKKFFRIANSLARIGPGSSLSAFKTHVLRQPGFGCWANFVAPRIPETDHGSTVSSDDFVQLLWLQNHPLLLSLLYLFQFSNI